MPTKSRKIESFDFKPGRIVAGKYEVLEQLGHGFEAEVYLLRETETGIERAGKFFYPERNIKNRASKFYALKLHKLRHCRVLIQYISQETMRFDGAQILFLVSEYVEGPLLSEFLKNQRGKRLTPYEAIHLLYALAKGLEEIHLANEYHGDLHADNVIVQRFGLEFDLKLLDVFHWKAPRPDNIQGDVLNLIHIFHKSLGGAKHYASQPQEVKDICCGLKETLILKKFRTAGHIRRYLEKGLEWGVRRMTRTIEVFANAELHQVMTFRGEYGEVCLFSSPAPFPGRVNEDSGLVCLFGEHAILVAVADGMGGAKGGSDASRMVVEALAKEAKAVKAAELKREKGFRRRVIDAIEKANARVRSRGIGSGSTVTVAEIHSGRARLYQVGDSVGFLVGSRGKLREKTVMHSPVGFAVESGLIDTADAMSHEERHYISNYVGSEQCWIEVGMSREMSSKDTLMIGTDGVFDNLGVDALIERVRVGDLQEQADGLAQDLSEMMHGDRVPSHGQVKLDDLTFVLCRQ